jgi:hypothetical protein
MSMTKPAVVTAISCAFLLVACGQQVAPSRVGNGDASDIATCAKDGGNATVVDAYSIPGSTVAAWLMSRGEAYSSTEVDLLTPMDVVSVCLVQGDFSYPHPAPIDPESGSARTEPTEAIEILGLPDSPEMDSIGPASKVNVLWSQLQKTIKQASASDQNSS